MTEVRFEDLQHARAALCSASTPWNSANRAGLDRFNAILVGDEPEYDLRRDVPAEHYPYLALPMRWRTGKEPEVSEPRGPEMAKYMCFFGYPKSSDLRAAEDWYLGHHTREGKQLPGLRRYLTYRHLRLPELGDHIPEAANFYRFTELCFDDIETQQRVCDSEGPYWTPSPRYGPVTWDWDTYKCFFIPAEPDLVLEPEARAVRSARSRSAKQKGGDRRGVFRENVSNGSIRFDSVRGRVAMEEQSNYWQGVWK